MTSQESHNVHYFCEVDKEYVSKEKVFDHLSMGSKHIISVKTKKFYPNRHEEFQNNILNKIEAIKKIEIHFQKTSVNLIKIITQNTESIQLKLDSLIKVYRNLIEAGQIDQELANKEVLNTFKIDQSLNKALENHFSQKIFTEGLSINLKRKKAKKIVEELLKNYISVFYCMSLSSDESFLVTGEIDGVIRVWDLKTYSLKFLLRGHKGVITSLSLGVNNSIMLSGSYDCTVRLWDLKSRKQAFKFLGHENWVSSVLIAQNNKRGYSGSADKSFKVWDLEKCEKLFSIYFEDSIKRISLIHEDSIIVISTSGIVRFCNLNTRAYNDILTGQTAVIWSMKFHDSKDFFILGFSNGCLQIWEKRKLKLIFESKKHTNAINSIDIIPGSDLFVTASTDKTMIIWDSKKMILLKVLQYTSPVLSAIFMKSCNSLILCFFDHIGLFNLSTNSIEIKISPNLLDRNAVVVSDNLRFLAYGINEIYLYGIENAKKISERIDYIGNIGTLAFNYQNTVLAYSDYSGIVTFLSVPDLIFIKRHRLMLQVKFMTFSRNEMFLAASDCSSTLVVYNIKHEKSVFRKENVLVSSAIFCFKDKKFIYYAGKKIFILDENFKQFKVLNFEYNLQKFKEVDFDRVHLIICNYHRYIYLKFAKFEVTIDEKSKYEVKLLKNMPKILNI